jgi:hypothetical protein
MLAPSLQIRPPTASLTCINNVNVTFNRATTKNPTYLKKLQQRGLMNFFAG